MKNRATRRARGVVAMTLALTALALPAPAIAGEPKIIRLGSDATQDAPPAQDLTFLDVGRNGDDLEIRIGVFGMLPVVGGIQGAGIEWTFTVRGRTFVAEAHSSNGQPGYTLYQVTNGAFEQIAILEGTYDYQDGFIRMLVPLDEIGAKPGTRVSGVGDPGTEDVDVHQHAAAVSPQMDGLATDKDYVIPKA